MLKKALYSPLTYLLLIILIYSAFFITYNFQKHAAFQTAGLDLGNHDQALWFTIQGNPLVMTTMEGINSRWSLHFEPILLLLVPIYAIFNYPQTLLVIQTIVVVLGTIPVFLVARQKLMGKWTGLLFAVVYLLFPGLQGAIVFDFHTVTLAATFLSFVLWFLVSHRYRLLLVTLLLALACKENISLVGVMVGGYIWLLQGQPRWAGRVIIIAASWFILTNLVIIPLTSPTGDNFHLSRYSQWGDNMGQVVGNLFLNPGAVLQFMFSGDRLNYWLRLTMPVAFTALLSPFILIIALPEIMINTLSTYPPNYQLDRFHYSIVIVPFVVVASINGVAHLVKWATPKFRYVRPRFLQNALLTMILIVTLAYQVQFGHTPVGRYFEWPVITAHHHLAQSILAQIPPNAAVAAQNNLVPHLSQRAWIFILPKYSHQGREADYVLFDMTTPLYPYDYIETYCTDIAGFLADPNYGLIFADDGLLLFKRNEPDTAIFEPVEPCL